METFAIIVAAAVFIGVVAFLVGMTLRHIRTEKTSSGVRRIWGNFGLSITLAILFFVTWAAQAIVHWSDYAQQQHTHGETATAGGYFVEFAQSTLENWQSEFLQLFSFVVLAAALIHRGSAESKDSDDRMEARLRRIEQKLDERV
jgi:hypothetical protein